MRFFGVLNPHSNFYKLSLFQTISFKFLTNGTRDVLMWAEPTLADQVGDQVGGLRSLNPTDAAPLPPPLDPCPGRCHPGSSKYLSPARDPEGPPDD